MERAAHQLLLDGPEHAAVPRVAARAASAQRGQPGKKTKLPFHRAGIQYIPVLLVPCASCVSSGRPVRRGARCIPAYSYDATNNITPLPWSVAFDCRGRERG